ncbi:preprotein translocase subunit YajC [Nocardioides sp. Root190]|uniref:preprotein translocase subunit YajC n=1 Tax=Nocardioides sp. Root190 TaxID=1736488 RepID=UPI000AA61D28|nr:preprotein translocase subunit YajC [Nocardioides sp. Root190]
MEGVVSLLPIVAIAAIFWFLIIRPASRQRKQVAELQSQLSVGDDVMLTSGIFGTIVGSSDETLELEIAAGVIIEVVRGAVSSVRREVGSDTAEAAEESHGVDAEVPAESTSHEEER